MRKLITFAFAFASFSATALPADRHMLMEKSETPDQECALPVCHGAVTAT
jgi:hypothetical protein